MSHGRAVATMLVVALLWSIAGVVTRHLEAARAFEITFWRSLFNAMTLLAVLSWQRGAVVLASSMRRAGPMLWASGLCWAVMFTAFMVALTLTTVANVLVTMALAPLFTALAARLTLGHRLPGRTWAAIVLAGLGIGWMFGQQLGIDAGQHGLGTSVAMAVPLAAAANWTLMQHARSHSRGELDMAPAALIGAALSALVALPLAWPMAASGWDLGLLALLGSVQLALPCLLLVGAARVLSAPEVSLLALAEVVFGVAWAWLGAGEVPRGEALAGGALVLLALAGNEALGLRDARRLG